MNELELLGIAYGFFIAAIVVEFGLSMARRDSRYRLHELIGNVGHGAVYQAFDFFTKALVLVPFVWVSEHAALTQLPMDAWWAWALAIVAFDFQSYWSHRHHHEVHAMWAVHAVHHAAEDFNLAAALRQPLFSHLFAWVYKLPLALFMPLQMFIGVVVIDYIYQFVQHTQYVGKLGPLEWVFNTPSHHRVHHGRQGEYLDRNYGGMLIVWDRLFGTFKEEDEALPPDYGITRPLPTVDPVWGNLAFWQRLVHATRLAPDFRTKVAVWLRGPGDLERLVPATAALPVRSPEPRQPPGLARLAYVLVHANIALLALPLLIYVGPTLGTGPSVALALFVALSCVSLVAVLECRSWSRPLEAARVAVLVLGLILLAPATLEVLDGMLA